MPLFAMFVMYGCVQEAVTTCSGQFWVDFWLGLHKEIALLGTAEILLKLWLLGLCGRVRGTWQRLPGMDEGRYRYLRGLPDLDVAK